MKTKKSFYTLFAIFIYIVVMACLIIFRLTGTIKTSWWHIIPIMLIPALYCLIFISIGAFREWLNQKHIVKAYAGTFKVYDYVIDPTGTHPNEPGLLIRHGAIWMIEYSDGHMSYVEEPYKLIRPKGNDN